MATIAAIGDRHRVQPLRIAGVEVHHATTDDEALTAWQELPADVAVLIVTDEAARALASRMDERRDLLVTVLP
ncbi:MAG TPA: V-type ATP synthase subunit F [Candidatus Dormibacteraeota bacterium]|nr:V-type ATP synthase subunit F [Candidatus Dormibacteraeota bacterium]